MPHKYAVVALLLIHPHIINLVAHGHGGEVHLASGAAHGKVQEQVHGGVEGVVAMAVLAVDGLAEVYLVEQFVVQVDADEVLVPIHAPHMELCCPKRVLAGEMGEGLYAFVPHAAALVVAPTGICQDAGHATLGVELHDVHLSARGPSVLVLAAEHPYCRP